MKRFRAISKSYAVSGLVHIGLITLALSSYDPGAAPLYDAEVRERLFITTIEKETPPEPEARKEDPPRPVVKERPRFRKPRPKKKPELEIPKAVEPPEIKAEPKTKQKARPAVRKAVAKVIGSRSKNAAARDVAQASAPDVEADGPVGEKVATPAARPVDRKKLERSYYGTLSSYLKKNYVYPRRARLARIEGIVLIEIVIDTKGRILRRRIVRSSGSDILDKAALASIEDIAKVPAPPTGLTWTRRAVRVPFRYRLRT